MAQRFEYTPDEWRYVRARSEERALAFFGFTRETGIAEADPDIEAHEQRRCLSQDGTLHYRVKERA